MPIRSGPSFAEKRTTSFLTSRMEVSHRWIGSYAVFSSVLVTGRLHNSDTHLWVKPYLSKAACWWTVCFQWALTLSSALLFLGWSSVLDSVWRLEISGRHRSLPPVTHFQLCTTSMTFIAVQGRVVHLQEKTKQTNMEAAGVQVYRPCSFDPVWVRCRSICDIVGMRSGMIFNMYQRVYTWRTVWTVLCLGGVFSFSRFVIGGGVKQLG